MNTSATPRSYWPYGIIGFFAIALTFIVTFVIWCSRQREDLVANNYYDNEIQYQQEIDRLKHTQSIATQVNVSYDSTQNKIIIQLPAGSVSGTRGQIHLYRPADERLDQQLTLSPNAQGIQHLDAKPLAPGLWKVRVEWNANGQDYLLNRSIVIANPS